MGQIMSEHVFISYVREDRVHVDRLVELLEQSGVTAWIDRRDLAVGLPWMDGIRAAIRQSSFFVACFSPRLQRRKRSVMFKELHLAVEELANRPPERAWFIPVKLSSCEIPAIPVSADRSLKDWQYIELFPELAHCAPRLLSLLNSGTEHSEIPSDLGTDTNVQTVKLGDVQTGRLEVINNGGVQNASTGNVIATRSVSVINTRKSGA